MLPLEDPSSNICENEGTGPTPSGHTHYLDKVFKMHLVKGCGLKEWAPPYYFHIHILWRMSRRICLPKCHICDPLIKSCQIGVWYFMWGTVSSNFFCRAPILNFPPTSFGQMVRMWNFTRNRKSLIWQNKQICPFAHYCKTYHSTKTGRREIQKWCEIKK